MSARLGRSVDQAFSPPVTQAAGKCGRILIVVATPDQVVPQYPRTPLRFAAEAKS